LNQVFPTSVYTVALERGLGGIKTLTEPYWIIKTLALTITNKSTRNVF